MKYQVCTTNEDYPVLLAALAKRGYHWLSGQIADEPPRYFRTIAAQEETLGQTAVGIRVISTDKKTISAVPIEIYSKAECQTVLQQAISVQELLQVLQEENRTKAPVIRNLEEFEAALREYVSAHYKIDIVDAMNTRDKNVLFLRHQLASGTDQILVKNMAELYQDYVSSLASFPRYADMVGTRYQYLLREALRTGSQEQQISGKEEPGDSCERNQDEFQLE